MQFPTRVELRPPDQPTDGCKLNSNPITTKRFYLPPTKRMKQTSGQMRKKTDHLNCLELLSSVISSPDNNQRNVSHLHNVTAAAATISSCKVVQNRNSWIIERLFSPFPSHYKMLPKTQDYRVEKSTQSFCVCGLWEGKCAAEMIPSNGEKENREKD